MTTTDTVVLPVRIILRLLACVGGAFLRAQGNGLLSSRVTIKTARSARKKAAGRCFLTLRALAGLASARIAVLRESSKAAHAAMTIAASSLFVWRLFRALAGAVSAIRMTNPVVSFFAWFFAPC
jgi:hypothetical protein